MAIRGKAMSVVICVNRLMSGIIAVSYQSMSEAMTPAGSFFLFSILSALSIAFYFFWVSLERRTVQGIRAGLSHRGALQIYSE